jgi:hypothetical protein
LEKQAFVERGEREDRGVDYTRDKITKEWAWRIRRDTMDIFTLDSKSTGSFSSLEKYNFKPRLITNAQ